MSKMIQVRNVPNWLHERLSSRAADRGQTLTAYVQEILEREVSQPTLVEWLDSIKERGPIDIGGEPPAEAIRAERREAGREP
jgi:plasmid stability protein